MTELQLNRWLCYYNGNELHFFCLPVTKIAPGIFNTVCCSPDGIPLFTIILFTITLGPPARSQCRPCNRPPAVVVLKHTVKVVTPHAVYVLDDNEFYRKQV